VAYKLQLPPTAQVHPVFHVSQLKPFTAKHTPVFSELPLAPDLGAVAIEPEMILDHRMVRSGHAAAMQILVQWHGLDANHATWEDYRLLKTRFPTASMWTVDQAQGGDSVAPPSSEESVDIELPTRELASDTKVHLSVSETSG
jgi:hypothetical protein